MPATAGTASNAVDSLRARVGAASDTALARMLGVSAAAVSRWRKLDRVPDRATHLPEQIDALSVADLRKAIALLPDAERRVLILELMMGLVGG